jgi:hypothetical protein
MWKIFFKKTYEKISFEDLQFALKYSNDFIIINTLPVEEQNCLIKNTLLYQMEEKLINEMMNNYEYNKKKIIIYGKNNNDETVEKKCNQLIQIGFSNVYFYSGGLFEWLLLQDIYGKDEFPTTTNILDLLKYKPSRTFGGKLIGYY